MRTVAIIPARAHSKRLPGKNFKTLGGIPLVAHSILFAQANLDIIDEIYVTTDCPQVKKIALEFGAEVIDRPSELCGDDEPTASALKHVLKNIQSVENVILLQPTNPLRPEALLSDAFQLYEQLQSDSLFTVSRNYHKLGKIENQCFVPFNYRIGQRSQDLEPLFFENGLLYITKASLINENVIISKKGYPFQIEHPYANVDIDIQDDFDYAEYLIKLKNTNFEL